MYISSYSIGELSISPQVLGLEASEVRPPRDGRELREVRGRRAHEDAA